jgi:cell division protein FtsB
MAVRSPLAWWTRRIPLALALAVALGWLPYQLFGESGLSKLVKLRADLARVRADNAELRRKNRALRAELSLYDDDDLGSVERIARDELGLVKPGEIVFKVEAMP